ncbi:hypothetical protein [Lysinibacillus sphaericus]|uniref:hypothetical protein n=1 Tax=Lysinibacillus TaxID=400634 RepID=UPI00039FDA19|nr:hypothetical protein [Lysinibacillus sphaericus]
MTKIYIMFITKGIDGQQCEQKVNEKLFVKKSKLKDYLKKEGYYKESKNHYIKINEEATYIAEIEKIKVK